MTDAAHSKSETDAVAAIARGLSKAQRYWVKEGSAHGDISMRMVRTLISKGLWYIRTDSPDGRYGVAVSTDLGASVRAFLATEGVTAS
jgi:hypothetical protein